MKKRTQILALVLAMLTVSPAIASCAEKTDDQPSQTNPLVTEALTEGETGESFDPGLPDGLDFEGKDFVILTKGDSYSDWKEASIWVEEDDGDGLNGAIFRRNSYLMETYNFNFKEIRTSDPAADINKVVSSQTDDYQVVMPPFGVCGSMAAAGNFMNLYDLEYTNFEQRWWDQSSIKDLTIAGKLYFVGSDISNLNNDATWCTMFSKDIIKDLTLPSPYDLVAQNEWTFENYYVQFQSASMDMDGDSRMGNDDRYANLTQNENYQAMYLASGERFIDKDEEDYPMLVLGSSERCVGVLDSLIDIMMDANFSYNYHTKASSLGYHLQTTKMFENKLGLFWTTNLQIVIRLRDLDADFGIVPVPKYDSAQEDYANVVWGVGSYVAVPVTCTDTGYVGAVLEAMAAKSRELVRPAYYDIALESKYLRDEESIEMLDIVIDQRVYDLGLAYDFGGISSIVQTLISTKSNNISKMVDAKKKSINKAIEKVVDGFMEND